MRVGVSRGRRYRLAALFGFVAVFLVFVWGGYDAGWTWTGLSSKVTLWDWLSLALLPLVIATATLWPPPERLTPAHLTVIVVWTTAAVLIVVAGYVVPWAWTGFTGNTAWDWVKLLLLPVLVPTVVLPRQREQGQSVRGS